MNYCGSVSGNLVISASLMLIKLNWIRIHFTDRQISTQPMYNAFGDFVGRLKQPVNVIVIWRRYAATIIADIRGSHLAVKPCGVLSSRMSLSGPRQYCQLSSCRRRSAAFPTAGRGYCHGRRPKPHLGSVQRLSGGRDIAGNHQPSGQPSHSRGPRCFFATPGATHPSSRWKPVIQSPGDSVFSLPSSSGQRCCSLTKTKTKTLVKKTKRSHFWWKFSMQTCF